jgi:membrane-associated phospholipid phosphatase
MHPSLLTDEDLALSFQGNYLQGTVLYGLIAYLLALWFPKWARWFYVGAILWVGVIGFSRLYLGSQWPFDVLVGIVIGFLWLMICIVLLRLQDIRQTAKRQKRQMVAESGFNVSTPR